MLLSTAEMSLARTKMPVPITKMSLARTKMSVSTVKKLPVCPSGRDFFARNLEIRLEMEKNSAEEKEIWCGTASKRPGIFGPGHFLWFVIAKPYFISVAATSFTAFIASAGEISFPAAST